ncbi:hypothetical protein BS78_04G107100 [Paspalum vaginatum]|nr:hypothetical protein BS78_04G107100 [Paspalum vaginatum]
MDSKNGIGGGVKVTYIETQFVTADAAGFKDLVQRLTGRSAPAPPPHVPHRPRPRPRRTDGGGGGGTSTTAAGAGAAVAGTQGYGYAYHHYPAAEVGGQAAGISHAPAPPCLQELRQCDDDAADFFDLFCYDAGASQRRHGDFPY